MKLHKLGLCWRIEMIKGWPTWQALTEQFYCSHFPWRWNPKQASIILNYELGSLGGNQEVLPT